MSTATSPLKKRFPENGGKIRRARERIPSPRLNQKGRPISQEDFAAMVRTTRRHIMRLERGDHRPSGELRDRIVKVTGTSEQIESSDDEEEDVLAVLAMFIKRTQRLRRETGDPFAMSVLK